MNATETNVKNVKMLLRRPTDMTQSLPPSGPQQ